MKRIALAGFIAPLLLLSSCFIRTHRTVYSNSKPIVSRHARFNNDSIRVVFSIKPGTRTVVLPFFVFYVNKPKSALFFSVQGKGISAREYRIKYKSLSITENGNILGKSSDSTLFAEKIQRPAPSNSLSPLYGSREILRLAKPHKHNLLVHFEFEISNKEGLKEDLSLDIPLEKLTKKSFKLFVPFYS